MSLGGALVWSIGISRPFQSEGTFASTSISHHVQKLSDLCVGVSHIRQMFVAVGRVVEGCWLPMLLAGALVWSFWIDLSFESE